MARMPNIEAEAAAAVGWIESHLPHHHAAPETPATVPATMTAATAAAATQQEEPPMSLAKLEDDVKTDLTDGVDWLVGFASRIKAAAPGIIETTEAVGGSTVGKVVEALAGTILPPAYETVAVDFLKDLAVKYGTPTTAATPVDAPPAQQDAGQAGQPAAPAQ